MRNFRSVPEVKVKLDKVKNYSFWCSRANLGIDGFHNNLGQLLSNMRGCVMPITDLYVKLQDHITTCMKKVDVPLCICCEKMGSFQNLHVFSGSSPSTVYQYYQCFDYIFVEA